jgi:hypothetical protein
LKQHLIAVTQLANRMAGSEIPMVGNKQNIKPQANFLFPPTVIGGKSRR